MFGFELETKWDRKNRRDFIRSEPLDRSRGGLFDVEPDTMTGRHPMTALLAGLVAGKFVDLVAGEAQSKVEAWPVVGGALSGGIRFMGTIALLLAAKSTRGGVSEGLMLSGIVNGVAAVVRMLPEKGGADGPYGRYRVTPESVFSPGVGVYGSWDGEV